MYEDLKNRSILDDELANQISSETLFSPEKESMYYYVREPMNEASYGEGFAEELLVES